MGNDVRLLASKPAMAENRVQNLLGRWALRRIMGITWNGGDSGSV
jgi:hypothetical protein